ncbi:lysophospholipid acyltransferase family protein [Hymenobacter metallicola]|uniref:Phospholipid/glycerol acyltransferase domain-containing protein n=1 Tax=Hymenobacter metallicola TaxID=2563114 RepID=A0A4Z0QH83_9BACT|nr:hypothetical protein [Hymenobacter metallicola]TGE28042.1 hypothetical protein E5K02_00835 [Hymenobacter metallicola]
MPTAPSPALPTPPPEIRANQHIYSDYFDEEFVYQLDKNILQLLDRVWFRSELVGFENYPQRNNPDTPLIFASNHSGMAFPWDAMVALSHLWRKLPSLRDLPRPLSAPMLSQSALMNPFLVRDFWKRCGCVDATTLNFETMMYYQEHNLMLYPEGVPGIGKGFNRKYQLQRLATSIIRLGIQHRTDIIPFYTINGEYLNPYAYSWDWINNLSKKIGIPFIPMGPIILMVLLQPWFFYMAFPAKLTFVLGSRIKPYELTDKAHDELSRAEYEELSNQVRARMQAEMDAAVQQYGQKPYRWAEMWQRIKQNWRYFPFFLPFAWPAVFTEFEKQYTRKGQRDISLDLTSPGSWLRMIWRNPFTISFFIPILGWIPIAIRGYKGHRIGKKM